MPVRPMAREMLLESMEVSMHRHLIPLIVSATLAGAGACAGTSYTATATLATPDLVYVAPGVYAVANFPDPVFYANNYYWRYDDGYWYRSNYYTGGWRYYSRPPVVLSRIERPYARYYRDRGRIHVDYRYYPSDRNRPIAIREHRRSIYRSDRYRGGDRPRVIYRERSR